MSRPRWYFSLRSPYSWLAYRELLDRRPEVQLGDRLGGVGEHRGRPEADEERCDCGAET